jgi:hypothetical protein
MIQGNFNIMQFATIIKIIFNAVRVGFYIRLPVFTELTVFHGYRHALFQVKFSFHQADFRKKIVQMIDNTPNFQERKHLDDEQNKESCK